VDIVDMLEVRKPEDIAPAFAALTGKAQALYVCGDNLTNVFHPAKSCRQIIPEAIGEFQRSVVNRPVLRSDRKCTNTGG
jgi:hypothetical protein